MKHVKRITVARADAFTDFWNALWRAWQGFRFDKSQEFNLL
ncbi:MAG: hypothetical protein ACLFTT_03530 [Candidatus Hydrogenedentota bacterium]